MTWTAQHAVERVQYKAAQELARRKRIETMRARYGAEGMCGANHGAIKIKMHISAWYTDPLDGLQTRIITQVGN